MLGIMRRAQKEREEREERDRAASSRAWRRKIAHRYNVTAFECAMPAVVDGHAVIDRTDEAITDDDFCRVVLAAIGKEHVKQALFDLNYGVVQRVRPTLRCRIFGCKPRGSCTLHPYCTDCQGRCTRCGIAVAPRAALRTGLVKLLTANLTREMTPEQKEAQRRSFVYGNTKIENDAITRETVDRAAEQLSITSITKRDE
jgi:hypothetical protein